MPVLSGSAWSKCVNASNPPAEAPTATMAKASLWSGLRARIRELVFKRGFGGTRFRFLSASWDVGVRGGTDDLFSRRHRSAASAMPEAGWKPNLYQKKLLHKHNTNVGSAWRSQGLTIQRLVDSTCKVMHPSFRNGCPNSHVAGFLHELLGDIERQEHNRNLGKLF